MLVYQEHSKIFSIIKINRKVTIHIALFATNHVKLHGLNQKYPQLHETVFFNTEDGLFKTTKMKASK